MKKVYSTPELAIVEFDICCSFADVLSSGGSTIPGLPVDEDVDW